MLLAVALVLCAVPAVGGSAGNGIVFMAVNDSIPMALSADTMPFYSGGTLYIPYTLFDAGTLGVTPSYNVLNQTLTLFNINSRIVFDLAAGTSSDSPSTGASWSTITKSGTVFVPADYCAAFFGIGVSKLESLGGYSVVRFTTGAQVYDDSYFIEKADSLIETRVSQYFNSGVTTATPSASVSPSVSPSPAVSESTAPSVTVSPSPSPSVSPSPTAQEPEAEEPAPEEETPEEEEEEPEDPTDIYLICYNAAEMDDFATALEAQGLTGAFFLTAEELAAYPTLCSRLTAMGHTVGLWLDGDDTDTLEQANALADSQTKQPLLWVYAPDGGDAAADLGYLVLTPDDGGDAVLWETDCAQGEETVTYCLENNYTIRTLRETTVFPVS
jgi:hypothetical protein